MTPEFAAVVNPTIHFVLNMVEEIRSGRPGVLADKRQQIRNLLDEAGRQASRSSAAVSKQEFELAQRALVYWADEILTISDSSWQRMTLEWELFNSQNRAFKFYVDGELEAKRSSANVIELWYLCVVLGFEGEIVNAFSEHLNQSVPPETGEEEFRKQWAQGLASQIQREHFADVPEQPLTGDLRTLTGSRQLFLAVGIAAGTLFVSLILLVVLAQR
ncbi:MAG: type VI protein secretion system component VasF [Planctomycetaceae bacterium]